MKAAHMKQKIVIPALVGMMMIPGSAVYAADQKAEVYPVLPAAGIETVVTDCYETKVKENLQLYLVPHSSGESFPTLVLMEILQSHALKILSRKLSS